MSKLYEKLTNGDKRTFVRRYKKGERVQFKGGTTVEFKANVSCKVTQEWIDSTQEWIDVSVDYENAVESNRKPDPKSDPLPEARIVDPFWDRVFGSFFGRKKEGS